MDEIVTAAPEDMAANLTNQIIERFGGIRPMAAKLDTPVTTVQGWKKRGAIPMSRHGDILAAAQRAGIALDPAELAATDPGGRAEARAAEAERPVSDLPTPAPSRAAPRLALGFSILALVLAVGGGLVLWQLVVVPLERRIAALESKPAQSAPDLGLPRRVAALEAQAERRPAVSTDSAAADRLASLERDVSTLKATAPASEQIAKQLSDLQVAASGRELLAQSFRDLQAAVAADQGQSQRLAQQIQVAGDRLDRIEAALAERREQALRAEAVVLATGQLRAALRTAKPFAAELNAVRQLSANDPQLGGGLDALQPLADTGVPTIDDLRSDLGRLAPDIVRSAVVGDGQEWWRQALYRIESVLSIRRVGQAVPGDAADAIVARSEGKLDSDDLGGAVAELRNLSGLPGDMAQPWIRDAEHRIAADNAEAELTRLSIARITADNPPPGSVTTVEVPPAPTDGAAPGAAPAEPQPSETQPQ